MKKLLITAALAATISLSACAGNEAKTGSYADIMSQAKATHAIAAKAGYTWKQKKMKKGYADHYMALAEAAHAKGDTAGAMKAANLALKTAKAEVQQINDNKNLKAGWEK